MTNLSQSLYRFLFAGAALLLPAVAFSKGTISGTVLNKETGDPMDFVSVRVVDSKTGKPLNVSVMTDEEGRFAVPSVSDGDYIIQIENIGSVNQERSVKVAGQDVNIGTVRLADDAKLLKEVVVEGIRSQMRFELDRKVFQVDANIASAGQSASELLESIPSVEVDQDGEVSLRGNSSVTVWIDGKESGLRADNRAQILEQIPGESIDRIEVITNPSAKFSPEGTAGIINIILKKDRRAGYFGSAEIGANSRGGGNVSANINVNAGKWDSYASLGFRMRHNKGGSLSRRDFDNGDFVYSDGKSRNHGNNLFLRLGTTFHLTDKDDFSLSGFGMFGRRRGSTHTSFSSNMPGQWLLDYQISSQKSHNASAHGEFGYRHKWSDNHNLDATVSYNYWGGPSTDTYEEEQLWPGDDERLAYRRREMPIRTSSWEAKLDYTNVFNQYLKLEAGYNGNYSLENTPNTSWLGTTVADQKLAEELYNRFIYHNDISAAYFTLGGRVRNFSYSGGVRAEYWQVRTRSLAYGETSADVPVYRKNNFALFPSLYLSLSLPYDNEMQLNYTRRIRRPFGGQLNSFLDTSDPTAFSYGNPLLEPQYSNSFELNYLKSWTYHMLSLSAYVRTADNMLNRLSYMDGDIMWSTWANVASETNAGLEIVSKNNLFRGILDLTTTVNLYQNHISAWNYDMVSYYGNQVHLSRGAQSGFAWDARMMANVKIPWSLAFQATGRYSSGQKTAQGSRQGGWSVDLGLRKNFGDWSVSLNCRDLFDSRRFKNTTIGENYEQYSERWRGGRTFRITVKYSFGNMKAKRDRRQQEPMESTGGYGDAEMD